MKQGEFPRTGLVFYVLRMRRDAFGRISRDESWLSRTGTTFDVLRVEFDARGMRLAVARCEQLQSSRPTQER